MIKFISPYDAIITPNVTTNMLSMMLLEYFSVPTSTPTINTVTGISACRYNAVWKILYISIITQRCNEPQAYCEEYIFFNTQTLLCSRRQMRFAVQYFLHLVKDLQSASDSIFGKPVYQCKRTLYYTLQKTRRHISWSQSKSSSDLWYMRDPESRCTIKACHMTFCKVNKFHNKPSHPRLWREI